MKKQEPLFSVSNRVLYKDGIFEAGMIQNSPHKVDKIYLRIGEMFFHLRDDEVFAILECLTKALWCESIFRRFGGETKLHWKTLKQITKDKISKPLQYLTKLP